MLGHPAFHEFKSPRQLATLIHDMCTKMSRMGMAWIRVQSGGLR